MIKIIAAVGKNGELGAKNSLLWNLPGDMKFFRETTRGCTVIMGRLTFESIGPLPKRRNIVITKTPGYHPEGVEISESLEKALAMADDGGGDIFVIGGASVYSQAIGYADEILLTEIKSAYPEADVYFPDFDKRLFSRTVTGSGEDGGVCYEFVKYVRIPASKAGE